MNYSRIYGAGKDHAVQLLREFNHNLTQEEALNKANLLYKVTKVSSIILNNAARKQNHRYPGILDTEVFGVKKWFCRDFSGCRNFF